jgi:hypothetical protein
MKIFQITFLNTFSKRVAAPNYQLFYQFEQTLPHLTEVIVLQDSSYLDVIIDDDGKVDCPENVEW